MMERERLLRRYALALSLVPDEDAAGDLFMDAADDEDLWRQANRLRQRSGLPAITAPPALPELSDAQMEYALHLAGRAVRRRRVRRFAMTGGGVLLCVLLALAGAYFATQSAVLVLGLSQPVLGLALAAVSAWLIYRRADPAAWWALGWGVLFIGAGLIGFWIRVSGTRPLSPAYFQQLFRISTAVSFLQWGLIWATAAYAVWRMWPRVRPSR